MDAIDAKILRSLQWHPCNPVDARRTPMGLWDIARSLEVHGNTVKRRLAEMENEGVLEQLLLLASSSILDIYVMEYAFSFPDHAAAERAVAMLRDEDRPGVVQRMVDATVLTAVFAPRIEGIEAAAEGLAKTIGAVRWEPRSPGYWEHRTISDLEWRVLEALMADPFVTPPEIGQGIGVTPKTVRRTIASLREKKAFRVGPCIDQSACKGLVPARLDVTTGGDQQAARRVLTAFSDLVCVDPPASHVLTLFAFLPTQGDVARLLEAVRSTEGVQDVRLQMELERHMYRFDTPIRSVAEGISRLPEWDAVATVEP